MDLFPKFDPNAAVERDGRPPAKVAKVAKVVCYSRAKHLAREAETGGRDLINHLRERAAELLDSPPALGPTPAESLIETCREYGVTLRLDERGDLIVGKAGAKADEPSQPWPSLLTALQAHMPAVAELVKAGWRLHADFRTGDPA